MSIPTSPGATFTAIAEGLAPGLVGTITFGVEQLPEGTLIVPETVDAIAEFPQGDGTSNYQATRVMPIDAAASGVTVEYQTAWPDDLVDEQEPIVVADGTSQTPGTLVDIEDLRTAVNVTETYAGRLEQILAGAEEWFIGEVRRQLTRLPASDGDPPYVHRQVVHGSRFVRVPDAREITAVTIDGVAVTEYELLRHPFPPNGPVTKVEVFARGRVVEVTGRFGFAELPPVFHEAILTLAARRVYEESAGLVDAVVSAEWGDRQYVKQVPASVTAIISRATVPSDRIGY